MLLKYNNPSYGLKFFFKELDGTAYASTRQFISNAYCYDEFKGLENITLNFSDGEFCHAMRIVFSAELANTETR